MFSFAPHPFRRSVWNTAQSFAKRVTGLFIFLIAGIAALHAQATSEIKVTWSSTRDIILPGARDPFGAMTTNNEGEITIFATTDDLLNGAKLLIRKYAANGALLWQQRYDDIETLKIINAIDDGRGGLSVALLMHNPAVLSPPHGEMLLLKVAASTGAPLWRLPIPNNDNRPPEHV